MTPQRFAEIAEHWLRNQHHLKPATIERHRFEIASLAKHLDGINGTLADDAHGWLAQRIKSASPRTVQNELLTLKQIVRWAYARGWVAGIAWLDELKAPRPPITLIDVPTMDDYRRIVADLASRVETIEASFTVRLLALTGVRQGEAERLEWRDENPARGTLLINRGGTGKRSTERLLDMMPPLTSLLREIRAHRGIDRCQPHDKIVVATDIRHALDAVCDRLGLPHYHAHHVWRHFHAVQSLRTLGVECADIIARRLGHSSVKLLLDLYGNHVEDERRAEAARRLGEAWG